MLLLVPGKVSIAYEQSIDFIDANGQNLTVTNRPEKIVSLVPSVTEMLLQLGVEKELIGVTLHDIWPAETAGKTVVGGFFAPDLDRVAALQPDTIFYAESQSGVVERFADKATLLNLSVSSIEESFQQIRLLGQIYNRQDRAEEIIAEQLRQLAVIKEKVARIPPGEKLRTVRLMGRDKVMVPGDNSFQNEYIRRAGGIAPQFGEDGNIIEPELTKWLEFNPQVIYGCGADRDVLSALVGSDWGEVDAVKNKRIFFFPCDLTCRASTHTGYFVSWLAARLYEEQFADVEQLVLQATVVLSKPVDLDFDYVRQAEILYSDILDFRNKSLLIQLRQPMTVLSTLEGWRNNISFVGNHYFPPPSWGLGHNEGMVGLRKRTFSVLQLNEENSSMLFTGADMDNLAIVTARFKDMQVTALVTAGVEGNAVRMGKDIGAYYELDSRDESEKKKKPGTINIILLTNTTLTKRAMTRALISAVEGKTAALQDLDIRSSATPEINPATGTGTDNILILQGRGPAVDATGGHTKMGELIARTVYAGTTEAIAKQNGITSKRSVFARLQDRKTSVWLLSRQCGCGSAVRKELEQLLLEPEYATFIAASFAISDQYERGLVHDLTSFDMWCQTIGQRIAGRQIEVKEVAVKGQPLVLRKALGALVSGLEQK